MGVIEEKINSKSVFEKYHYCHGHTAKLKISFDKNEKEVEWRCDIC